MSARSIKILSIANSWGDDSVKYLWNILNATCNYDEITVGQLYRGGCDTETHLEAINASLPTYRYYLNESGIWSQKNGVSSNEAISERNWDVIVTQTAYKLSTPEGYQNVAAFYDKVKALATNPNVRFCWNMTWSTPDACDSLSELMQTIQKTAKKAIGALDGVTLLPTGTAIQNVRSSFIGNTLNRDKTHLELGIGCYTAALAYAGGITGCDTDLIDWTPEDQPEVKARLHVIKECVKNALNKPFEITNSQYTESDGLDFTRDSVIINAIGKDFSAYKTAEIEWMKGKWYNYKRDKSTPSTSNFYYCTQLYTPETLPVGSIIVVDDLYSVMPVKFKDTDTLDPDQNAARYDCHLSAEKIIIVDEAFWNNNKFVTFNISHYSDELNLSYMNEGGIRIYIPKN